MDTMWRLEETIVLDSLGSIQGDRTSTPESIRLGPSLKRLPPSLHFARFCGSFF